MINDLQVDCVDLWKYVDDTAIAETVLKNHSSNIQAALDGLVRKTHVDCFQLNESKCKELRISFSKSCNDTISSVVINNKSIKVVSEAKLLGLDISIDLSWNTHVLSVVRKVGSRLYLLRQFKHANPDPGKLLCFYVTYIRPVAEYACQVFHNSLPAYLSNEFERLQKHALRIIYP